MADTDDDVTLKDGSDQDFVAATDYVGGKHYQWIKEKIGADGVAIDKSMNSGVTNAGTTRVVEASDGPLMQKIIELASTMDSVLTAVSDVVTPAPTVGITITPTANFARPADATPYTSGDLIANNTTAASVLPMSFVVGRTGSGGSGMIRGARIRKSSNVVGVNVRLHLFAASPTTAAGDNVALAGNVPFSAYLGAIDVAMATKFSDAFYGDAEAEINFKLGASDTIYGLLEIRGAYTPVSGESFYTTLEVLQN